MTGEGRIARRFAELREAGRGGLVAFVTAGDPDAATSAAILAGLPAAGADLIELGVPFSDPMADGPAVQASSQRALRAGQTLRRTLDMVADFRRGDDRTPVVLMGYYNPIYVYGAERFCADACDAGVDGLIIVDLPREEADEMLPAMQHTGLDLIPLVAPTTDDHRLPHVVEGGSGFVYYVSITGITGTAAARVDQIGGAVPRVRQHTRLPVAVGFGIRTPDQAAVVSRIADAAVVGSALVQAVADGLDDDGAPRPGLVEGVLDRVGGLAAAVRAAGVEEAQA